jgi:hypothetical protein
VDVRPFVKADAEATELIQPSKGPLDDPAPPAQPAPVLVRWRGAVSGDITLDKRGPSVGPDPEVEAVSGISRNARR